jgi:chromosome segregation ATPase
MSDVAIDRIIELEAKLRAACRERDEAYDERVALVGKIEALREQLSDRDQDVRILTRQLGRPYPHPQA